MTYLIFVIKSAVFDFSRNKGRTALTSLGILIGVLAVVLLMALGLGLKKYIQQQFESLGTNLLYVLPGSFSSRGGFGSSMMGGGKFDNKDVISLSRMDNVKTVLPFVVKMGRVSAEGNSEFAEVAGSTADMFPAMNIEIDEGAAFSKAEVTKGSKIMVLGPGIARKLFGSTSEAVGKTLQVEGQAFRVIGVARAKGGGGLGGTPSIDDHIYAPYTAVYSLVADKKFFALYIEARDTGDLPQIKTAAKEVLLKRYDEDDFSVTDQTEILSTINAIFSVLNTVLVAIAAISLLVGGIGIMNIMYVTVTERIKEIGVRRAVGATQADILWQFLAESVILSLFGGLLGLFLAFIGTLLVQSVFPAYIDSLSVLLALGVSSAIGIIFGVFPARKAANLSPIEAIRYE